MKTIIITGASGSGKTYLSRRLHKLFNNSIVITTDSYYRDNILIRFISKFIYDIYDKLLSIKKNEIQNTIRAIYKKNSLISLFKYDFRRKRSSHSKIKVKYAETNQFLIIEGIFAHRLDLNYQECINIVCQEKKKICFRRRLKRDQLERGRDFTEVKKKFNRSWNLFYQNIHNYLNIKKIMILNPANKVDYNKLINRLKKYKNN